MVEYKTERISPQEQDEVMQRYGIFGWQVANQQEVYNKSQSIKGMTTYKNDQGFLGSIKRMNFFGKWGQSKDSETKYDTDDEVTNYVTITFGRDTNMPNYPKIKDLEIEYYDVLQQIAEVEGRLLSFTKKNKAERAALIERRDAIVQESIALQQ